MEQYIFIAQDLHTEDYEIQCYKTEGIPGTPISPSDDYADIDKCKTAEVTVKHQFKHFQCQAYFPANRVIGLIKADELLQMN